MIRRLGLLVLVMAFIVVACGRQVTPDRGGGGGSGLTPGFMQVKYRVAQSFDFANVRYVIVFNTSGNGRTPYPNGYLTQYQDYSFAFVVGGSGSTASVALVQYVRQPGPGGTTIVTPVTLPPPPPQQLIFLPNSDGQGKEFTIIFDRNLLIGLFTPTPSPTPVPTTVAQGTWYFNYFTTDLNGIPYDSLGQGGATDTTFSHPLDTTSIFDTTFTIPPGAIMAPMPSEQITGGEISNNP